MSDNFVEMDVEPRQLFRSIYGFKYQLNQAVGDLVDNSVDAEADRILIYVSPSEIIIVDNGDGMDKNDLKKAITPWGSSEQGPRKGKRGVYGIGLKSASFSLGEVLEIHTKKEHGTFYHLPLDYNDLVKRKDKFFNYSTKETDLWKKYKLNHGTIIRIAKVNKRKVLQPAIDKLKGEIGLMFFRLIEKSKITILVNDEKVAPLNPLLPELKANSPKNYYHDYGASNIKFTKSGSDVIAKFKVHAVHIGRASHWSNAERTKYRYFLRKQSSPDTESKIGMLKLDEQGIYLMRNDRLITLGGWLGIVRGTTLLHHDVALRVIIEYDSENDDLIGVDHTKTKPDIDDALKNTIRDLYLQDKVSDSENRFRIEGEPLKKKRQEKANEELKTHPRASSSWAKKNKDSSNVAKKVDPEKARREKDKEEQLKKDAEQADVWFKTVERLPYNCLWAGEKNKEDKVLVLLNENHAGYASLYLEDDTDQLRKNLNYFFYNLASFEVDVESLVDDLKPADKELLKQVFKEFRRYVSRQMTELGDED